MSDTAKLKPCNGILKLKPNSNLKRNSYDDKSIRSTNVAGIKNIVPSQKKPLMPRKTITPRVADIPRVESKTTDLKNRCPSSGRLSLNKSINKCGSSTAVMPKVHKLGELPDYLRKKSTNPDQAALAMKRKSYFTPKHKVSNVSGVQAEVLTTSQNLAEIQKNLEINQNNFIELDSLEIISITKDTNGNILMLNNEEQQITTVENPDKNPLCNLEQLEKVSTSITDMIDSGYKLCKEIIDTIKTSKLINPDQIGDGDGDIDKSEILKHLMGLECTIEVDAKNKKNLSLELFKTLYTDNVINSVNREKDELEYKVYELNDKITQLKINLEDNQLKALNLQTTVNELEDSHAAVKKQLEEELNQKNREIACRDDDISQLKKTLQNAEDHKSTNGKTNETLLNELVEAKSRVLTLQTKVELMRKQFENTNNVISLDQASRKESQNKEIELQKLYDKQREHSTVLENKLRDTQKELEKTKRELQNNKNNVEDHYDPQLWAEFQKLKMNYDQIILENDALKKSILNSNNDDVVFLKNNLVKAHLEIQQYEIANKDLIDGIQELQSELTRKTNSIKESEESMVTGNIKNYQNEINNIPEAEMERKRELESMKNELAKCRVEIKQQEETIYMHTRLLRIRSELINSLQEKESSTRCCVEDLYAEIAKKTALINQMNHEISAKAEELQNLFSTLGNKEMELSRQETIIKMLEDNDARNQRLRIKQEEKISRLEHENSELKHVISIYQEYNPELDFKEINKNFFEAKSVISTRDFFHEERREKRQVEIEESSEYETKLKI